MTGKPCACNGTCHSLLSPEQRDEQDVALLKAIIARRMRHYPYGEPHPETVDMMASGLLEVIEVSNSRPEKYKDEPWREQTAKCHVDHATTHSDNAWRYLEWGDVPWLSDDGTPEMAHAVLRGMMCLWQHRNGK